MDRNFVLQTLGNFNTLYIHYIDYGESVDEVFAAFHNLPNEVPDLQEWRFFLKVFQLKELAIY